MNLFGRSRTVFRYFILFSIFAGSIGNPFWPPSYRGNVDRRQRLHSAIHRVRATKPQIHGLPSFSPSFDRSSEFRQYSMRNGISSVPLTRDFRLGPGISYGIPGSYGRGSFNVRESTTTGRYEDTTTVRNYRAPGFFDRHPFTKFNWPQRSSESLTQISTSRPPIPFRDPWSLVREKLDTLKKRKWHSRRPFKIANNKVDETASPNSEPEANTLQTETEIEPEQALETDATVDDTLQEPTTTIDTPETEFAEMETSTVSNEAISTEYSTSIKNEEISTATEDQATTATEEETTEKVEETTEREAEKETTEKEQEQETTEDQATTATEEETTEKEEEKETTEKEGQETTATEEETTEKIEITEKETTEKEEVQETTATEEETTEKVEETTEREAEKETTGKEQEQETTATEEETTEKEEEKETTEKEGQETTAREEKTTEKVEETTEKETEEETTEKEVEQKNY